MKSFLDRWQVKVEKESVMEEPIIKGRFINLHHHDEFSVRAALGDVEDLIKKAKEYGMTHLAITNYMEMSGWVKHYFKCIDSGIVPILGIEAYISNYRVHYKQVTKSKTEVDFVEYDGAFGNKWQKPLDSLTVDQKSDVGINWNILLYAKNNEGYYNLIKCHNDAQLNGVYELPRMSEGFLQDNAKGVIAVIPNPNGEIINAIDNEDFTLAKAKYDEYCKIFDAVYLELSLEEDDYYVDVNNRVIEFCHEHKIPMVVGINSHYVEPSDESAFNTLLGMRKIKGDKRHSINVVPNMSFKSPEQVRELFERRFKNDIFTELVFEKCLFNIGKICNDIPKIELDTSIKMPVSPDSSKILSEKAWEGLRLRGFDKNEYYRNRLQYELDNIVRAGFSDYFLMVEEMTTWCHTNGVPVGAGRGCFTPNMRVTMADGMMKFIPDVVVGDKVISGTGVVREVENVFVYDVDEEIISLELNDGRVITCTLDHKILVNRNNEHVWVEAKDLCVDDDIVELSDLK